MGERNRTVLSKQTFIQWSITFWKVFVTTLGHSCTCSWYNKSNERIWCSQKKIPSSRNFESIDPLAYHKMLETTEDSFARGRRIGGEKVK